MLAGISCHHATSTETALTKMASLFCTLLHLFRTRCISTGKRPVVPPCTSICGFYNDVSAVGAVILRAVWTDLWWHPCHRFSVLCFHLTCRVGHLGEGKGERVRVVEGEEVVSGKKVRVNGRESAWGRVVDAEAE